MRFPEKTFKQITGFSKASFRANTSTDVGCAARVRFVPKKCSDLARSKRGVVAFARNAASNAEPLEPSGVVRLVMAVRHHQHWPSSTHSFACCADSTLMNNDARTWKDGCVRRIRHGDNAGRQFANRLVSRVSANQKYSSPAKAMRSLSALQEKIPGSTYSGGAKRKDNGRFASIEELVKLRGLPVAVLEKGKTGGMRV